MRDSIGVSMINFDPASSLKSLKKYHIVSFAFLKAKKVLKVMMSASFSPIVNKIIFNKNVPSKVRIQKNDEIEF